MNNSTWQLSTQTPSRCYLSVSELITFIPAHFGLNKRAKRLCFLSLSLVLLASLASSAFAVSRSSDPKAVLEQRVFDSELAAVVHAMNTYNPQSIREDREFIGAIYKLDRSHGYLYSVAPGSPGRDQVSASIPKLKNAQFVSFWHTHGSAHRTRHFFSDVDTQLVKQWNLPFYLGCADGQLRVFRPGDKTLSFRQAQLLGLGKSMGYARGNIIKHLNIAI